MFDLLLMAVYSVLLFTSSFFLIVLLESETLTSGVEWRDEWPSLSIVIPAYNEEDCIEMTVDSVEEADYPGEREIIVVNDGSQDRTREIVEEYEQEGVVKLINQENQGKGAALNTGLEVASGELFVCVDADSILVKDGLKNIVSEMSDDASVITSAMKVYEPQNMIQKLQRIEYIVGVFMRKILGIIDSIHIAPGPMSVYRRKDLEEIGGFDNDSLVEDQEVCFRFQDRHDKLEHSRHGVAYTIAPSTLKGFYIQRRRWWVGSFRNAINYRYMLFDPEYGDFGMFVIPIKLIQASLSVFGLFLMVSTIVPPLLNTASTMWAIGLDAFALNISGLSLGTVASFLYWKLLSINFNLLALLAGLMMLSASLVYLAAVHTKESLRDIGILPISIYVFWFFLIVGFLSLVSLFKVAGMYLGISELEW